MESSGAFFLHTDIPGTFFIELETSLTLFNKLDKTPHLFLVFEIPSALCIGMEI